MLHRTPYGKAKRKRTSRKQKAAQVQFLTTLNPLAGLLASSSSVFNDIKPRWTASLDQHGHVKHEDADGACAYACVLGFVLALVLCTSNR